MIEFFQYFDEAYLIAISYALIVAAPFLPVEIARFFFPLPRFLRWGIFALWALPWIGWYWTATFLWGPSNSDYLGVTAYLLLAFLSGCVLVLELVFDRSLKLGGNEE